MTAAAAFVLLTALSPADLARLEVYEAAFGEPQPPPALVERARAEFGGRGPDVARHYLLHTGSPSRPGGVFFVLRAVGDAETALVLIGALATPPAHQSGNLDRHPGEVATAAEMVLESDAARLDPRVVPGILRAVEAARRAPYGPDEHAAATAVRLLGKCRSMEAVQALQQLLGDPSPSVRVAAAAALGDMGMAVPEAGRGAGPTVAALVRTLREDPSHEARAQAAGSLALLGGAEAAAALRAAAEEEKDPRVLDAVVSGLRRMNAPLQDPALCRALVERAAETAPEAFNCWRAAASAEDVLSAALAGPPQFRALALHAFVEPAADRGALVKRALPVRPVPPAKRFPPELRDRLLESAVVALSRAPRAVPHSVWSRALSALWEIAGRDMAVALHYADRVRPTTARFETAKALQREDPAAYAAVRRTRQAALALAVGLGALLLAAIRQARRSGIALAAACAVWAALVFVGPGGARSLPPPPLWLATVSAIGCLAAGASAAAAALLTRPGGGWRSWVPTAATPFVAGGLALVVCAWTRSERLFPMGGEGWELLFEPLLAAVLAGACALALAVADRLFLTKLWPEPASAPKAS